MPYVDVNVFVYWLGDDRVFGEKATAIVKRVEREERAVTSTLTPWLVHVILAGFWEGYDEERMLARLGDLGFRLEPLPRADYQTALRGMEKHRLDLEDALHGCRGKAGDWRDLQ